MKRTWLDAHLAEVDVIEGRLARFRWRAGSFATVVALVGSALMRDPLSVMRGGPVKIGLGVLSAVNLLAGMALVALWLSVGREPMIVLVLAVVLIVQGGYSLAYVAGALDRAQPAARGLLLAGSTAALAVGAVGFVVGAGVNLRPTNPDPEYGPMTVALLLATHGLAVLAYRAAR
jgi:hypothetical protein